MPRALVFGGSGQIGGACADALERDGFDVVRTARRASDDGRIVGFDAFGEARFPGTDPFDAVVWAQGANMNDSIRTFDSERHLDLYKANALFVAATLQSLLVNDRFVPRARLCVISSVWQTVARRDKLSYMSAAIDLAEQGILINAVLPGALDTPMTHANLSVEQVARLAALTPFNRLASINDVANLAAFLCSAANTSITGQFVSVDLGFQNARLV